MHLSFSVTQRITVRKDESRFGYFSTYQKISKILNLTKKSDVVNVFLLNSTNTEQIAGMINLYINLLADPKKRKKYVIGDKVDQKRLEFNPKLMICSLCVILINLVINNPDEESKNKFIHEIVQDSRSFTIEVYLEAQKLFNRFHQTSQHDLSSRPSVLA